MSENLDIQKEIKKSSKRIYFVRHGQTKSNVEKTVQPPDDPLNEIGLAQAKRIAERSKSIEFQKIFSSDYERAVVTAETIAQANDVEVEKSPLFRECRGCSKFLGIPHSSEEFLNYLRIQRENRNDPSWHFADEENYHDISERADKAWELLNEEEASDILVVTHGLFLRMLISKILLGDMLTPDLWYGMRGTMEMSNTGITVCVCEDEKWRLLTWNDHSHFAD